MAVNEKLQAKTAVSSPRIGINAHLLSGQAGYRRAGIHQYIAQVLRHLPTDTLHPVVFARETAELIGKPNCTVAGSRWPTERRLVRILWEQLAWPWLAARQQIDLLHSMAFVTPIATRRPTVVTVYDLSFIHYPENFPPLQRWYLTTQTRRSVQQARRIITISKAGRRDAHRFFSVPLSHIDVVYPGVETIYRPLPTADVAGFRRKQELPARFVLHVGTLQPRKNIPVLLEAFARLLEPDVELVLVGGRGWMFNEIFAKVEALGLQDRVRFTGYVPDEALPLWYNAASVLVVPSLYEGFGLPAAEAMACGTPVIVSGVSSLPEVVGEAGLLCDPYDTGELANCLTTVLNDEIVAATMRDQGLEQASTFSWERAGQETAVVYQKALRGL